MKFFLPLIFTLNLILTTNKLYASEKLADKQFLKCLGKEELYYHKQKVSGAYPKLNEKLISEMLQMSDTLTIKRKYQKQICDSKNQLPSVTLLKLMILKQRSLYVSLVPVSDVKQRSMDQRTINEIVKMSFHVFIKFIDNIQTQSKKPNCVINKIPELKKLYRQTRYTLEDQGIKKIINDLDNLEIIFKNLNDKRVLDQC